jgi:hypothetical protein
MLTLASGALETGMHRPSFSTAPGLQRELHALASHDMVSASMSAKSGDPAEPKR